MPRAVAVTLEDEEELLNAEARAASARARDEARAEQAARREVAKPAPEVAITRTIEERLAAVEATAGLAEVESSLTKWVLFSAAGVLVGVLSLVFTLNNATNVRIDHVQSDMSARFDSTNARLDQLQSETNARFDQTNAKIDSAVAELRAEMNVRFDQTNARIDQSNARLDQTNQRLDQINQRLDRLFELVASPGAARSVRD